MTKPKMLYVEWLDSAGTSGWIRDTEFPELEAVVCCTLGFIVKESKTSLVLALNYNTAPHTSGRFGEAMSIPKVAILRRRVIR